MKLRTELIRKQRKAVGSRLTASAISARLLVRKPTTRCEQGSGTIFSLLTCDFRPEKCNADGKNDPNASRILHAGRRSDAKAVRAINVVKVLVSHMGIVVFSN